MIRLLMGIGVLLAAPLAQAYVGPGLGVGVIGAMLGLLVAIVMAAIGTVWYPLKRLLRARSQAGSGGSSQAAEPVADSALHIGETGERCETQ
jgi:hypothetical protein